MAMRRLWAVPLSREMLQSRPVGLWRVEQWVMSSVRD
jgi:hypothetical protein